MAHAGIRRVFTAVERAGPWRRWKDGSSVSDVARALGREPGTVHSFLSAAGGIAQPPRRRSKRALSLAERKEISRGLCAGWSIRAIARQVGRPPSTVCREIDRNGGRRRYRAALADSRAWGQARRPQICKLRQQSRLRALVDKKLRLDWSPEQIAGWLKRQFPNREETQVSHETIYRPRWTPEKRPGVDGSKPASFGAGTGVI